MACACFSPRLLGFVSSVYWKCCYSSGPHLWGVTHLESGSLSGVEIQAFCVSVVSQEVAACDSGTSHIGILASALLIQLPAHGAGSQRKMGQALGPAPPTPESRIELGMVIGTLLWAFVSCIRMPGLMPWLHSTSPLLG